MTTNMTCGQAAIALLEQYGVDTVFGIPGVHTLDFYRGLADSSIRHVGVRHEQGAGFMADGYARASGRPGVCCVITGPGVTNAATPIGQAFSDSVPVLMLSSVNGSGDLGRGRGRLHEITDQQAAIAPLVSASHSLRAASELPVAMADAFDRFASQRPRPVHIELPLDLLAAPALRVETPGASSAKPGPSPATVRAAAELLREAKRPLMLVGGGTVDCAASVKRLAELTGSPVVVTVAAKGVLPDDHPLCLGSTLVTDGTQALLASADVVLAVGTELAETDSWVDRLEIKGKLIRIDLDPRTIARDYPATVAILADAGLSLDAIASALDGQKPAGRIPAAELERLRQENLSGWPALQMKHRKVLDAVRAVLPEDGMIASDMTQIAYTGNYYFPMSQPRCWFHPVGYGTLGYALPAAIGAKLARPESACVAIAGDAGFLFTVQELATAVELKLPIAILLWNNDALGQIAGDMVHKGIPEIAVKPRNPDFQMLGKAFGAHVAKPTGAAQLKKALTDAFTADGPTLIEVHQNSAWLD
ncbi:MAG TPA: 5-guanidino-2-oxopentanoate decarboxylase [Hypericibacter adhaerens]|jgi:5-guanidino-2-oxopentanoate decarboxylase|uniref:Putative 2-ketoarginine decarboxylase AruI n=1 Tax=Hypericibacter adhaerens TaxID=2602016 RepID=A0A5J6MZY4_9PROT|nr:5-guanidino-2-oxopentanoate decarboxylase [Hypericibacter adhaerens]QEX22544.1 putative 2-ketoarginine decarboxylase AruI [Hypericibacter adhaerens]HWA44339.1 5-guanidino-2-oxopentanoate decarboxylase [Hypericibacter adhaerens]